MITLPMLTEAEIKKEIIYHQDEEKIDKIIEKNSITNEIIKVTTYDYFNNNKIKSVDEYSDGKLIRSANFSLFKTVTEYDKKTGKKYKVTNYDIKNNNKKTSVYDFDLKTEKLVQITVFRTDGENIAFIKEISPQTGEVKRCINYKKNSTAISSVSTYETINNTTVKTTFYYNTPITLATKEQLDKKITEDKLNKKILSENPNNKITQLIDNLYKTRPDIGNIAIN